MSEHDVQQSQAAPSQAMMMASAAPQASADCGCGGSCGGSCPGCGAAKADVAPVLVYALGRVRPRIPTLGLEKEIAQATGGKATRGKSSEEALCAILTDRDYDYLAREVCWVFSVQGVDAFIVRPYDSAALNWVLSTVRTDKGPTDVDVVVGRLGGRASMMECNGLMLPTVSPSQVYSFDRATFAKSIDQPRDIDDKVFESAVKQTLDVTSQIGGNYGISEANRAVNYLVTRDAEIYELVARQLLEGAPLVSMNARQSALTGGRRVVDVILGFRGRKNDVNRTFFARVDVSDVFPFLVSSFAPYFVMS